MRIKEIREGIILGLACSTFAAHAVPTVARICEGIKVKEILNKPREYKSITVTEQVARGIGEVIGAIGTIAFYANLSREDLLIPAVTNGISGAYEYARTFYHTHQYNIEF